MTTVLTVVVLLSPGERLTAGKTCHMSRLNLDHDKQVRALPNNPHNTTHSDDLSIHTTFLQRLSIHKKSSWLQFLLG